MPDTIQIETDERGVATLTLNRPEKHNAMSGELIAELADAARQLGVDRDVRVIVLTGAGKSFCAGGDLNWMKAQMVADNATRAAEARKLAMMLFALNTMPKPLIGRVQGNAFGGGIGLASVCDVAVSVDHARFGLTETRLGLIPATIGPYVVARMGEANARRVFMSSRLFGADEALSLGVIARVTTPDNLDATVEEEINPYLSCAPGAIAEAKALARRLGPVIDEDTIEASINALITRWKSEEAKQGIDAFFANNPAPWT